MITIADIRALPYDLPLRSPLAWGRGHKLAALNHVLVIVALSDGSMGIAEATPRPSIYGETPDSVLRIVQHEYSELLLGQPAESLVAVHALDEALAIIKNNNTARGALNMALTSAVAQSSGQGLAELLGADQERVRVSYILGTGPLEDVLAEVAAVYARGVRFLKVKVGKDFTRELALVRAIRDQYGPDMAMYADANQCYAPEAAHQQLAQLAAEGVQFCEEPLPVNQLRERSVLRAASPMPLIGDDSCFTLADFERELDFDTVDIVNIKTARNGFSQARAIYDLARAHGKGVMIGSQASSLLGCLHALLFSLQAGIDYPTEGTFYIKTDDVHAELLTIHGGYAERTDVIAALDQLQPLLLDQMAHQR